MALTVLLVFGGACVCALLASMVIDWASRRSALWNMLLGGVLVFLVIAGALVVALLLAG